MMISLTVFHKFLKQLFCGCSLESPLTVGVTNGPRNEYPKHKI